ncbi:MAG: hypothetical protein ACR2OO_04765 [Thermomicrobiales bacterium]
MNDPSTPSDRIAEIPEAPSEPAEVKSAARTCSVIILLLAGLLLIACIVGAALIFR